MIEHHQDLVETLLDAIRAAGDDAYPPPPNDEELVRRQQSRKAVAVVTIAREHETLLQKKIRAEFRRIDEEVAEERKVAAAARRRYNKEAALARSELERIQESGEAGLLGSMEFLRKTFPDDRGRKDEEVRMEDVDNIVEQQLEEEHEKRDSRSRKPYAASKLEMRDRPTSIPKESMKESDTGKDADDDYDEEEEEVVEEGSSFDSTKLTIYPRSQSRGSKRKIVEDDNDDDETLSEPRRSRVSTTDNSPWSSKDEEIPSRIDYNDTSKDEESPMIRRARRLTTSRRTSNISSTAPGRLTEQSGGSRLRRRSTKPFSYNERAYYKSVGV